MAGGKKNKIVINKADLKKNPALERRHRESKLCHVENSRPGVGYHQTEILCSLLRIKPFAMSTET